MKIYQVIKCYGEMKDYDEKVIGTYFDINMAEIEKKNQEKLIQEYIKNFNKCCMCDHSEPCFEPDEDNLFCANEVWVDEEMSGAKVVVRTFNVIE